jgi:hypothetical protein
LLIPGDGRRPICQQCAKARRECDRRPPNLRFVVHSASPGLTAQYHASSTPVTVRQRPRVPWATPIESEVSANEDLRQTAFAFGTRTVQSGIILSQNDFRSPETLEQANSLAACSPRTALSSLGIARLFAHYIDVLAPWYDLNESSRVFGTTVPSHALDCPVLFKALIAFAATHRHKTSGESEDMATAFHAVCVRGFLESIEHVEPESHGDYLAATCLLRSYEILNGNRIWLF